MSYRVDKRMDSQEPTNNRVVIIVIVITRNDRVIKIITQDMAIESVLATNWVVPATPMVLVTIATNMDSSVASKLRAKYDRSP